jgi:hypothetical protein
MKKNSMKHLFLKFVCSILASTFLFLFFFRISFAVSSSTSSSNLEVEQIKDKIASKVAEISDEQPFIFRGKAQKIEAGSKTFELSNGAKTYSVSFLSNTNYFWLKNDNNGKLALNFSNIEDDDDLVVLGTLIKVSNQIKAKTIYGKIFPKTHIGKVVSISKDKLIIKTISSNSEQTIDVSALQNVYLLPKKGTKIESVISEVKKNDLIVVYGYLKSKNSLFITPLRISIIQN